MHDPLGDEMKALERAQEPPRLSSRLPIYARIDGHGFSRFTRGMRKPFDPRMTCAMQGTALGLMEMTQAAAAYVQSDEISLLWFPTSDVQEALYGGRHDKLTSLLAGQATAQLFNQLLGDCRDLKGYLERLPHFDARILQFDSNKAAADAFAWRGQDARRNAVNMLAQAQFSHKALQGKSIPEVKAMLAESGVFLDAQPSDAMNGTLFRRVTVQRCLTPAERSVIPEPYRPGRDELVTRKDIIATSAAHPGRYLNLEEMLFEGADPILPAARQTEAQPA